MLTFKDLEFLDIKLPEDLSRIKAVGDYKNLNAFIDQRLKKDIPFSLKRRLILEKEIIKIYENEYIYSYDEGLKLAKSKIKDFTKDELDNFITQNKIEWIYKDKSIYFLSSFLDNLIKTEKDIENRQFLKAQTKNEGESDELDIVIDKIKKNGQMNLKINISHSLRIKEKKEELGEKIRVYLPLPLNAKQIFNVDIKNISPEYKELNKFDSVIRTVMFEKELQKDDIFKVEYSYENRINYVKLDPSLSEELKKDMIEYLKEKEPHIVFTPYLKKLLKEIIKDEKNPIKIARLIYDYITKNVNYSYMRTYFAINNIAEYCALNLKGDCGVQALLFIVLLRMAKIPARWQAGLYTTKEHCGNHDWAEFYVEPYGWVFADLSFGGAAFRKGKLDRWNYYFGNLDPYRMVATNEFQKEFNPPMKYLRNDPYDNQSGECEYSYRAIKPNEYEVRKKVISIEEI